MVGVGSSMFFEMLLVMTVTFISAASGEESVTENTLNKDPFKEHFHTSEHTNYSKENHGEQRKKIIVVLVAKMRVVDKLEETSTIEDLDSTTGLEMETTEDSFTIDTRVLIDAPVRSCEKNFQRDRQGKCRPVFA